MNSSLPCFCVPNSQILIKESYKSMESSFCLNLSLLSIRSHALITQNILVSRVSQSLTNSAQWMNYMAEYYTNIQKFNSEAETTDSSSVGATLDGIRWERLYFILHRFIWIHSRILVAVPLRKQKNTVFLSNYTWYYSSYYKIAKTINDTDTVWLQLLTPRVMAPG